MRQHEIIIVGGGLAGSALAVGLARAGRDTALIEAAERRGEAPPSFDDRTLVINAASLNILAGLGVLGDRPAACSIRHIEISHAGAPGYLKLNAADHGHRRFGAVIVARELGAALLAALGAQENVSEYCPARVETIDSDADGVTVTLADGRQLRGRLLIGADGSGSPVRRNAGMATRRHDYGQAAMIFNVMPESPPAATAFERFTAAGPLALLPQPEERMGVVWIDAAERIDAAMSMEDEQLSARLDRHFAAATGRFHRPGRRARYPLALLSTPRPIATRTLVIGNAANTIHPVSAQGFNLGLRDVAGLIDALDTAPDPGADAVLESWLAARRHDQAATVRYTDTLARAFTNPSRLTRAGSSLGLALHAAVPALSRRLVRAAMGFREPVSSLARGDGTAA